MAVFEPSGGSAWLVLLLHNGSHVIYVNNTNTHNHFMTDQPLTELEDSVAAS